MTLLQIIQRLTRGYIRFTGKQPDNVAKIKIKQEALQKFQERNKVKSLQDFKDKKGIKSLPVDKQFTTKPNVEEVYFDNPNDPRLFKPNIKTQAQDFQTFGKEVIDDLNAPIKPDLGVVPKLSKKERILQIDDELDKLVLKEGKYGKMNRTDRENEMIRLQDESSTLQEKTLFKDSPEAIAKIKAENKAAIERLKAKKKTPPEDLASGGMARVGYAGGRLVKGASWVINKLKEQLFDIDLGIGGSRFSKLGSTQKDFYKKELNTLIKQLEQGGEIPNEMLDTMIADPKFKSVVKTRSIDKDLYDLEDVLLDRQAGKVKSDDLFDAEGKLNKKAVLQEVKDSEEKMLLDKFDVKGRTKQASGGIAGQLHMNRPGYASGELAGWEFKTPDKKLREFTPEEIEKQRELLRDMLKKQKEFEDSLGVSYSKEMPEDLPPVQGPDYETNNPNQAGKEIIRRIIGSGVTGAPIGGGFSLDVPYGEGEDFDFGIGYKTDPRYGGITGGYGINLDGDDTMGIGYQGDNFGGGVKKQEGADSVYTGGYQGDNFEIGVSKEEGSEPYFTFKKKLKKKKKPIFGKAKGGRVSLSNGGLANILGV